MLGRQSHFAWLSLIALAGSWLPIHFTKPTFAQSTASDDANNEDRTEERKLAFFESKIRPLLIDKCLECHSSQIDVSGGLVLDSKLGWQLGGDSGPAIEAGSPDKSLLMRAILYDDPHLRMPPDGKLDAAQIADLRRWIEEGAIDPRDDVGSSSRKTAAITVEEATKHWAYRPLPSSAQDARTSIDAFVDARLNATNLQPNPPASRSVLLRRLTIDLHGLVPTPEEIAAFEADTDPLAYEKVVDRLLGSRRFAERMARHWLDVARYAESLTLRGFILPEAWRYRDYCIEAFDRDQPFHEFLREQVAGDLMPSESLEQQERRQVAVTFLLMGNTNLEEQDKKQLEMDLVDEQLEVLGRAILGQTIGCARCHDHKFDPIPTRDYYAMAGILKSSKTLEHDNVSKWIERPLPLPIEQEEHYRSLETRLKELKQDLAKLDGKPTLGERIVAVEDLPGTVVDDSTAKKIGNWIPSSVNKAYVGAGYLHDGNTEKGSKSVTFEPPALPSGRYEVRLSYSPGENRCTQTSVRVFSADGESEKKINQKLAGPIDGLWISLGEYAFEQGGQCFVIVSNENSDGHVIADAIQFLSLTQSPDSANPSIAQNPSDAASSRRGSPSQEELESKRKDWKAEQSRIEKELSLRPKCMAMLPASDAKDLPIHIRGSVHQLGELVPRGFLQLTQHAMPTNQASSDAQPMDRLALADWIAAPTNPLTARVAANRIWYWMMGEGLVRSVDNFGTTGEAPSHPELLDWLASQYIHNGWSTKKLVRQIVLSKTYQRSSSIGANPHAQSNDPENRWLWRANRKRMDAETIRDSMLQISGELKNDSSGRSFDRELAADYGYKVDPPVRSIFLPAFRNSVPDLLAAFDQADNSVVVGKRNQTTVAQQALVMLNHPWIADRAMATAKRVLATVDDPQETISVGAGNDKTRNDKTRKDAATYDEEIEPMAIAIWGRLPSSNEWARIRVFLREQGRLENQHDSEKHPIDERLLADLLQSMFASLDFRFVE